MKNRRYDFTGKERQVIARQKTPLQVQHYLNGLDYNDDSNGKATLYTFRGVVRTGSAHCLEGALAAATILEQHGYPTLLLDLASQDNLDHVVFLYKKDGKWGTVGRSRDPGLHGRRPVFRRVYDLVESYADPYVDLEARITGYGVFDLTDLGNYNWRLSERNVWRVENALIDMPHRRYKMPDARYRLWYDRYVAFKKKYPNRKPLYYTDRKHWKSGYPRNV
ncbi:MAG: hypothetical protein WBF93_03640 [Pirellulales bacterium]